MTTTVKDFYLNVLMERVGETTEALTELFLAFMSDYSELINDFFILLERYETLDRFEEELYLHAMHKLA